MYRNVESRRRRITYHKFLLMTYNLNLSLKYFLGIRGFIFICVSIVPGTKSIIFSVSWLLFSDCNCWKQGQVKKEKDFFSRLYHSFDQSYKDLWRFLEIGQIDFVKIKILFRQVWLHLGSFFKWVCMYLFLIKGEQKNEFRWELSF